MMLKPPIHIVIHKRQDYTLADFVDTAWENGEELCSRYSWTWAVYQLLKRAGYEISVGYSYREHAINIIHYYGVMAAGIKPHKFFTVYLRADYRSMPFAHLQIVQNKMQSRERAIWIKHHPQPGMKPRKAMRNEVTNVAFFGSPTNSVTLSRTTLAKLNQEGLTFYYNTGFADRSDYSSIDIAIGIREFSTKRFDHKPATKMTNAWLAGIPFVGGFDSAFEQNGKPGHDYIQVADESDLIEQLVTLKNNPSIYQHYLENTRDKAKDYSFEACSESWNLLVEQHVMPVYENWRKRSGIRKIVEYSTYASFNLKEKLLIENYHRLKKMITK